MIKDKRKFIDILTTIIYIMIIVVYELFYCNINFINGKLGYNLSIYRFIVYGIIYILYFIFKDKFIETAVESFKNKKKIAIAGLLTILSTGYLAFMITEIIIMKEIMMPYVLSIIGVLMLYLFTIYFSKDLIKNTIVICLTFGILFSISITVNNQLDEKKHFLSVYSLSLGDIDTTNHTVDLSIANIGRRISVDDFSKCFSIYPQNNLTKNYSADNECDTPAGGNYEITYITPAIGVAFARILGGSIADIYFTGRIFNLLTFCALICIALKILPFKKNTFFICIFMPMILALASVYTADTTALGFAIIFISYCLKLAYQEDKIKVRQLYILGLTFLLTIIGKGIGNICVGLVIFILPIKKIFKDNKKNMKYIVLLIFLIVLILGLILFITSKSNIVDEGDSRSEGSNVIKQLNNILNNPLGYFETLFNSFKSSMFNIKSIGFLYGPMFFGYKTYYYIFGITLPIYILISMLDNSKSLKIKTRIIFALTFLAFFAFTSTVMYLSYTKVGANYIDGFQMRYLFPVIPLLLSCISIKKLKVNINAEDNNILITSLVGIFMTISYYFILINLV